MATLRRKKGTQNWLACYTDHTGKRVQKTTGTANKREAQKLADKMEEESGIEPPAPAVTAASWVESWIAANNGALSDSSFLAYSHRTNHFLKWLGARSSAPLPSITKADIIAYRTDLLKQIAPSTVNLGVKILRMMFEAARREKVIPENPAADLKTLKHEGKVDRRPFTMAELQALLKVAEGEWRSMILFGVYTGQRLNDIALLTWSNIDTEGREVRFRAKKTGRFMAIPLAGPLTRHLAALPRPADGSKHIHPDSAAAVLVGATRPSSTLSNRFRALMAVAGLVKKQPHRKSKHGRESRREMRDLVFHSLRHTATSMMKNAGISEAVVMDIIGHDSPAVSAMYTHIDSAAKRAALDSMPDLVGAG